MMRSALLEVAGMPFIQTARCKGLAEGQVLLRHALPNAVLPVVTVLGLQLGALLAGAVITEVVFAWPGIGQYITTSLLANDMNSVLGGTIVIGTVFIALNLFSDFLYRFFDPRSK